MTSKYFIRIFYGLLMSIAVLPFGVCAQSLIVHWPLDEKSGTQAADVTGHGYHGKLITAPIWAAGKINGAMGSGAAPCEAVYLNAGTQFIQANISISISVWINHKVFWNGTLADSLNRYQRYINLLNHNPPVVDDESAIIRLNGRDLEYYFKAGDSVGRLHFPANFVVNKWYHIVSTWNGTIVRLYVNGVERGNLVTSATMGPSTALVVGTGGQEAIEGSVDDVRVYRGVLSKVQVESLYISAGNVLPSIAGDSLSQGHSGTAYLDTVRGFGGKLPYSWSVRGNPLPAGLVLNSATGIISGTPTTPWTHSITFQLVDSNGDTALHFFPIKINGTGLSNASSSVLGGKLNPLAVSPLAGGGFRIDCRAVAGSGIELSAVDISGKTVWKALGRAREDGMYTREISKMEFGAIPDGIVFITLKTEKIMLTKIIQWMK